MNVYGYIYSTDENLEVQKEMLKSCQFAIEEVFIDNNVSREVVPLERSSFKALFQNLKKGDICVVTHNQCLGFSAVETLETAEALEKIGVKVPVLNMDGLDINSEIGHWLLTMIAAMQVWQEKTFKF